MAGTVIVLVLLVQLVLSLGEAGASAGLPTVIFLPYPRYCWHPIDWL
ncbi:hypothetical protein [Dickeya zeae]|nr:hypothetical protein [Dickeya zeae]